MVLILRYMALLQCLSLEFVKKFQMSVKNPPGSDASGFFVGTVDCLVRAVDVILVVATVVFTASSTVVVVLATTGSSCLGIGVGPILMTEVLLPSVNLLVISTINSSPSTGSI